MSIWLTFDADLFALSSRTLSPCCVIFSASFPSSVDVEDAEADTGFWFSFCVDAGAAADAVDGLYSVPVNFLYWSLNSKSCFTAAFTSS